MMIVWFIAAKYIEPATKIAKIGIRISRVVLLPLLFVMNYHLSGVKPVS